MYFEGKAETPAVARCGDSFGIRGPLPRLRQPWCGRSQVRDELELGRERLVLPALDHDLLAEMLDDSEQVFAEGTRPLTLLSNCFTNLNLTDMEAGHKAFRLDVLRRVRLREDGFGFEPEVTAKIAALRCRIYEVGISYHGRTYEEGKKIGWLDGLRAVYCILGYNLLDDRPRTSQSAQ